MNSILEIDPELIAELETCFEYQNEAMIRLNPLDCPWKPIRFVGSLNFDEKIYGLCPIKFAGIRGLFNSAIIRAKWIPNGMLTIGADIKSIVEIYDTISINSVEFIVRQNS